jgi:DNA-binding winged helix-turn-helix (wHTH) protein/Tol biopolymer transport system component
MVTSAWKGMKARSVLGGGVRVPPKILLFSSDFSPPREIAGFTSNIAAMTEPADHPRSLEESFKLGEFVVHPQSNELTGPGGVVRLRPILMDLLVRLAREPGKPVAREELIADVWPRRMVNDEVLSRAVADLRTVLGDSTREPRYIETLPKVGYRLVAPTGPVETQQVAAEPDALQDRSANSAVQPPARGLDRFRGGLLAGGMALAAIGIAIAIWHGQNRNTDSAAHQQPSGTLQQRIAAAENFTSDVGQELLPRFSPDGLTVAFMLRTGKSGDDISQIALQDIATRKRVLIDARLADLAAPVFHPDGKRLAYFRQPRGDGLCGIVVRELANAQEKLLVDCAKSPRALFDWSPDGASLVLSAPPAPDLPAALALLDEKTGQWRWLTRGAPGEGQDTAPRFDRTGRRIAYMRGTSSHREVWVMEVSDPRTARRIGPTEGQVYGVAWLDDRTLLAAADWHGARALNVLDLDSGRAELAGARGARYPDVSRNGALIHEVATFRSDLWESEARSPGKDARLLWPSTRYTNQAEYGPDGNRVVFASNRDGQDHLYVAERAKEPRRLALTAGHRYIRPHWSGDGRRIYATRIEGGAGKLTYTAIAFDLAAGKETALTALGEAVADVREWNAAGALLVAENERHAFRLSVVTADGTRTRLALPLVSQFELRGNRLAYSLPQLNGLTLCEVPALRCERRDFPIGDENRFEWTLGDGEVWFRGRGVDGKAKLVRQRLNGGQPTGFDFAPTASGLNIAIDPSGKSILLARESEPAIDLFLSLPQKRAP